MDPDDHSAGRDPDLPIDPDLAVGDPGQPYLHGSPPGPQRRVLHQDRRRASPDVLAAISLGGMLGASARYGIAQWLPTAPGRFPWATFWTNLAGSFLLGLILVVVLERFPPTRYLRPFVATGVLGAFTTMSTFQVETALLLKDGHVGTGLLYGIGSVLAGLALAYAGIVAGRLTPTRQPENPR